MEYYTTLACNSVALAKDCSQDGTIIELWILRNTIQILIFA